jgi:hypothetical protein
MQHAAAPVPVPTPRLYGVTSSNPLLPAIENQLRSLAFRWKSPLRKAFSDFKAGRKRATVVWLEDAGRVLAWGILVWNGDVPEIMLYTRTTEQRKGYARQVFWALRHSLSGEPNASYVYYAHDPKSSAFYAKRFEERCSGSMPHPQVVWLQT